jgi:hypothetical protein
VAKNMATWGQQLRSEVERSTIRDAGEIGDNGDETMGENTLIRGETARRNLVQDRSRYRCFHTCH